MLLDPEHTAHAIAGAAPQVFCCSWGKQGGGAAGGPWFVCEVLLSISLTGVCMPSL